MFDYDLKAVEAETILHVSFQHLYMFMYSVNGVYTVHVIAPTFLSYWFKHGWLAVVV